MKARTVRQPQHRRGAGSDACGGAFASAAGGGSRSRRTSSIYFRFWGTPCTARNTRSLRWPLLQTRTVRCCYSAEAICISDVRCRSDTACCRLRLASILSAIRGRKVQRRQALRPNGDRKLEGCRCSAVCYIHLVSRSTAAGCGRSRRAGEGDEERQGGWGLPSSAHRTAAQRQSTLLLLLGCSSPSPCPSACKAGPAFQPRRDSLWPSQSDAATGRPWHRCTARLPASPLWK